MGPPEQDSNIKKKLSASEFDEGENFVDKDLRDKFSTFFSSRYSINYFEYQSFFVHSR